MRYVDLRRTKGEEKKLHTNEGRSSDDECASAMSCDDERDGEDEGRRTVSEDGTSAEDATTLDDIMTGGMTIATMRKRTRMMTLRGSDVIAALELKACDENEWGWRERDTCAKRFQSTATRAAATPELMAVDAPAKTSMMKWKMSGFDMDSNGGASSRGMELIEVPTIMESDTLASRLSRAINNARAFHDDSTFEDAFKLDDERLENLDCVENDLSLVLPVERRSSDVQRLGPGTLKSFMNLFISKERESACILDDSARTPLKILLGLAEKTKVVWTDALKTVDQSSKAYLKNLLCPPRIDYSTRELERIESANRRAKTHEVDALPKFAEVVHTEARGGDIRSLVKPLTLVKVFEDNKAPSDPKFANKAKENTMTSLLLDVPGETNAMQPVVVPRIDEGVDDSAVERSARALERVVNTVNERKEESKVLPKWNVKFPFLAPFNDDEPAYIQKAPMLDEFDFDDDDFGSTDLPGGTVNVDEAKCPSMQPAFQPPTLSESFEIPETPKRVVMIEQLDILLNPQQLEIVQTFAERYAQLTRMLPFEVQEMVPRFQIGKSAALAETIKVFDSMPTVSQRLKCLLCCLAAANLVNLYGFHIAYLYMNVHAKQLPDLFDVVELLARFDTAVCRGDVEDHPKLQALTNVVANTAITGGKLLIIFPDTTAILSIKKFVAKFNTTAAQFDGRQEFKHLSMDGGDEDLIRAVKKCASTADVTLVLEDHVAHDAFPMEIFSSCVYYAPSDDALSRLNAFGLEKHASNKYVHVLCMKHNFLGNEDLEPASSELMRPQNETRDRSNAIEDEPQLSPPMDFGEIPRHIVVYNTARQLVRARERDFAQVEQALRDEGVDVTYRQSTIDVDALVTVGSHVHGVLLIVPEYFAEGSPTQFEIFSLAEDLTMAMAACFISGTVIFEGDEEFLRLAQSIENRLIADARKSEFSLDVRYCVESQIPNQLLETLRPREDALSNFMTAPPKIPSKDEVEICSLFPRLNAISACAILALEPKFDILGMVRNTGTLSPDLIEYLHGNVALGCPPTVLGNQVVEQQREISSPRAISYSPQVNRRRSRALSRELDEQLLSPPKMQRITNNWEINSPSPIRASTIPFGKHSYVPDRFEAPSPVKDVSISPPSTPRTFLKPLESTQRQSMVPKLDIGGGLWPRLSSPLLQTKSDTHQPSRMSTLEKRSTSPFNSSELPCMIESYRMPPPRPREEHGNVDPNRNLAQHRFKKIQTSNRLPNRWC